MAWILLLLVIFTGLGLRRGRAGPGRYLIAFLCTSVTLMAVYTGLGQP